MRLDSTRERFGKACLPGGASTPLLTADHLDVEMDFDAVAKAGSRLGTGCVTVLDDNCCIVRAMINLLTSSLSGPSKLIAGPHGVLQRSVT